MNRSPEFFTKQILPLTSEFLQFNDPGTVTAENVTALDLDNDGTLELVFHLWQNSNNAVDTDHFVKNKLVILDNDGSGWRNITEDILNSTPFAPYDLGGATRQNRVADLNGDGFLDIAWSVNQEDGRSGDSNFSALTSIMLSSADGTYTIAAPGEASWYHAIGTRPYDANRPISDGIVIAAGYTNQPQAFFINENNEIRVEDIPYLGASTLLYLESLSQQSDSAYFFGDSSFQAGKGPTILAYTPSGAWEFVATVDIKGDLPEKNFSNVPLWNGDISLSETAYLFEGDWVTGLAPDDAREIDVFGDGNHTVLSHLSGFRTDIVQDTVRQFPTNYLMLFSFTGDNLTRLDTTIYGYDSETNRNFIDVLDLDGDGLEDIVTYDYVRSNSAPLFNAYRNLGDGDFRLLDLDEVLPVAEIRPGSALIRDFNNDGIFDILSWASDGNIASPNQESAVIYYANEPWLLPGGKIPGSSSSGDEIIGSEISDILSGQDKDDILVGKSGNDTIIGGHGSDIALYSGAQVSYTLQMLADSVQVIDRRGSADGADRLTSIELLQFGNQESNFDLTQFTGTSGLSEEELESFIELYIAYFNRAPDAVGLNFWGSAFANGMSLDEIAAEFAPQPETVATYPEGTSNTEFVTTVYNNILGRGPDQGGLDFWVNGLEEGGLTRDTFILKLLGGVEDGNSDRAYLDNKVDLGAYFAVHKGMSDGENAKAVMDLFGNQDESNISGAKTAIDDFYTDALDPTNGEFLLQVVGVLDNPFDVA